jgi:zinc protease
MIQFSKYTLPNGLRVIHHHDISTPLVCMNILYDVGARDEDENKTGFAHLFEHLMFGGSVNIPNYDEPLQMVGGENNAFTTNDITNYYLTLPADNVETAFWLESDRMLSLAFGDKSLEVQRNVVIEEFKQRYLNQPYGDVWLILKPLCYKVHPYKWNTIGKEIKHIEDATMEDVKSFFKTHYHPSNAILVVAGNIDFNKTEALTEKWFGGIEAQVKKERNLPKEPKQNEARTLTVERNVPQNAIYKAYHVCNRYHADYYCMDVISDILSNGDSARLYNSLVKEQKLFTEINAYITGDLDEGMFIVSGKLCEGIGFEKAEQAINHELEMMKKEVLNDNELQKIKNKIESIHVFSETSISNKALNLAVAELMGDANRVNTEIDYYLNMKAVDIQAAANLYLQQENSNTLYYQKSNQ